MYKVKIPATSANLGCGFDVLGIALSLFNEYSFEQATDFSLEGFATRYLDTSKNLVLSSYLKAFEFAKEQVVPVKITELSRKIPRAGGLGSSASCAVAGILGANHFLQNKLSKRQMLELATSIDGHPDNVASAIYGGLTACMKVENGYLAEKYGVSNKLKFMVCYPDYYVSTEMARGVLPKTFSTKEVVENLSRIANLPRAFETGNMELIKECVKDNLHEPYRINLIEEGELIRQTAKECGGVAVISGSGATMLVICTDESVCKKVSSLKTNHKWTYQLLEPYMGE